MKGATGPTKLKKEIGFFKKTTKSNIKPLIAAITMHAIRPDEDW